MASNRRNATFLASLGAGLEYYDFIIYAMLANQLSLLFFSGDDSLVAQLKTFGVFAVGYLARPFGGIFFGMVGDTFGRKKTFQHVMLLMALSTLCIGLLPTYGQVGTLASCALLLLRVLQAFSLGAELPGAVTIVCEQDRSQNSGLLSGFVFSGVSLGSALASFVLYLMTTCFTQEQILHGAWRLPFLLGGSLAGINCLIRRHMAETPLFLEQQGVSSHRTISEPLKQLVKGYWKQVLEGICLIAVFASLVIFTLYLPTFLQDHSVFSPTEIYFSMTLSMLWYALVLPASGIIADRFNKAKVFTWTCLAFLAAVYPLFMLLKLSENRFLLLFMIVFQTFLSFFIATCIPLLSSLFPTSLRFTGVAACYNIVFSAMGCLPLALTALSHLADSSISGIGVLMAMALVSLGAGIRLQKKASAAAYS